MIRFKGISTCPFTIHLDFTHEGHHPLLPSDEFLYTLWHHLRLHSNHKPQSNPHNNLNRHLIGLTPHPLPLWYALCYTLLKPDSDLRILPGKSCYLSHLSCNHLARNIIVDHLVNYRDQYTHIRHRLHLLLLSYAQFDLSQAQFHIGYLNLYNTKLDIMIYFCKICRYVFYQNLKYIDI